MLHRSACFATLLLVFLFASSRVSSLGKLFFKMHTSFALGHIAALHAACVRACCQHRGACVSCLPADSFEKAVLSNTNVGGENCHRGAALGALMGAALGEAAIPQHLIDGLAASAEIRQEIDAFCEAVLPAEQPAAAGVQ